MKPRLLAVATVIALGFSAASAQAAMIVHDPVNYLKLIDQARTALDQLNELKAQVEQGKQLFDSLNDASGVNQLANLLNLPSLREFLPELENLQAAARGDLDALGAIGARAKAIREGSRLHQASPGDTLGEALEATGLQAARDLALGEAVTAAGAERLAGLEELQEAIDAAPNARAVLDLQARTAVEQAMIANDQMRLQGLVMAQDAEERLNLQRERERAAALRTARMALYRQSFQ